LLLVGPFKNLINLSDLI